MPTTGGRPSGRSRRAGVAATLLAAGLSAPAAGAASAEPISAPLPEGVLARWSGGEISERRFHDEYDPEGRAARDGRKRVRQLLTQALFEEIYSAVAARHGIEREPEIAARLAAAEEEWLAREWLRRNVRAEELAVDEGDARRIYDRDCADFMEAPRLDIEVLFVRADLTDAARESARLRLAELDFRLERGESFGAVAEELRSEQGGANGRFPEQLESELDPRLRSAIDALEPGQTTAWVESVPGYFRVRLESRAAPAPIPPEKVDAELERRALAERRALVEHEAAETVRRQYGLPPELPAAASFAHAAREEGLAEPPAAARDFARQRRRILAEAAILRDPASRPAAAILEAQLAASDDWYRLHRLRVLALPAEEFDDARRAGGQILDRISAGEDAADALALAGETVGAVLQDLPELTRREIAKRSGTLARAVERLDGASWAGPLAVGWHRVPEPDRPAEAAGSTGGQAIVFLAVMGNRLPSASEVDDRLMRSWLGGILGDPDRFLSALGERWQLRMIPLQP